MEFYKNLSLESIVYVDSNLIERKEIWRDLPNCEGKYKVSNLGRVKSLKRTYINNGNLAVRKEKILKGTINVQGYRYVTINHYNLISVHLIVAITFLNHKQCGYKTVVDHIDENKLNNCVDNLRLTTSRENTMRGWKNVSSKFTGVSLCRRNNKWTSIITINFKSIFLGYFDSEEETKSFYDMAFTSKSQYDGNNKKFRNLIKEKLCLKCAN